MAFPLPAQLQSYSLSGSGAIIGATSITLKSFLTIDGVQLTINDFNGKGYMTMEPNSSTQEEQISFTGVTLNSNGTTTLSGVKTVAFVTPYTETSGLAKTHAGSTTVVVSNTSGFYNAMKTYIDDGLSAGAVPATTTTNGIGHISSAPSDAANPIFLNSEEVATSGNSKVMRSGSTGYSSFPVKFGGTGADGALALTSGATNIDLGNASVVVKNYTSISITGSGSLTFTNPNTNGTTIILKSQGAVTLTSSAAPMIDASALGAAGGTGGSDTTGGGPANGNDGSAGVGISLMKTDGAGGGVAGGPGTAGTAGADIAYTATTYLTSNQLYASRYPWSYVGAGGGGGSASAIAGSGSCTGGNGGRGGGGLIIECGGAFNFTTTSGISVAGGAGTNASNGAMTQSTEGGGGGGGGGYCLILYNTLTANTGTITVTGGAGGTGATVGSLGANTSGSGGGGGSYQAGSAGDEDPAPTGGAGATGLSIVAANTEFA